MVALVPVEHGSIQLSRGNPHWVKGCSLSGSWPHRWPPLSRATYLWNVLLFSHELSVRAFDHRDKAVRVCETVAMPPVRCKSAPCIVVETCLGSLFPSFNNEISE